MVDPGAQEKGVGLKMVGPAPPPPVRLVKSESLKKSIIFT